MAEKKKNHKGIDNLKPIKSKERARELGRKGGLAYGESVKKKKAITEAIKIALEQIDPDTNQTNAEVIAATAINLGKGGSINHAVFVRDTAGEKPTDKLQQDVKVSKYEDYLKELLDEDSEEDGEF